MDCVAFTLLIICDCHLKLATVNRRGGFNGHVLWCLLLLFSCIDWTHFHFISSELIVCRAVRTPKQHQTSLKFERWWARENWMAFWFGVGWCKTELNRRASTTYNIWVDSVNWNTIVVLQTNEQRPLATLWMTTTPTTTTATNRSYHFFSVSLSPSVLKWKVIVQSL